MKSVYSYTCSEFPGREGCPARFDAPSEEELVQHIQLHAVMTHEQDPTQWRDEDLDYLKGFIKYRRVES